MLLHEVAEFRLSNWENIDGSTTRLFRKLFRIMKIRRKTTVDRNMVGSLERVKPLSGLWPLCRLTPRPINERDEKDE